VKTSTLPPREPAAEPSIFAQRSTARKRAWICPGAGFAYFGRRRAAAATYLSGVLTLLVAVLAVFRPTTGPFLLVLLGLVVSTVLWIAELIGTYTMWPTGEAARGTPLGYRWGALVIWLLVAAFAGSLALVYRPIEIGGNENAPTLFGGERIVYSRFVDYARLQSGKLILFRLNAENRFNEAGTLALGRILAGPDDRITRRGQTYYVGHGTSENLRPVRDVAPSGTYPLAFEVLSFPKVQVVPRDRYFIMQDSVENGLDSRVLSWAHFDDIISTDLYRVGIFPPLKPIE
jgi:signal peptidase I